VVSAATAAVLRVADCRAVLAGTVPAWLAEMPRVRWVEPRAEQRSVSPAASYAVDAVTALEAPRANAALFTFAGPPGSCLRLFQPARDAAGALVGPGFGVERSRHIHPFTVLLALQNQVAATLSMRLDLRGPCCSTTDSAAAFVDLLPNMALAARARPVLAVFASAARAEHLAARARPAGETLVEGAVALLFTAGGELGSVGADAPPEAGEATDPTANGYLKPYASLVAPSLEPGLAVLYALGRGLDLARFEIREPGRTTALRWSRP